MHRYDVYERKMSKRLHLIKRIKSVYTRDNVPCGFSCCKNSVYSSFPVFVIPTEEILIKYKALLKSEYIKPILCHSVLMKLSINDQKRIKDIAYEKGYFVFYDTFFSETYNSGIQGVLSFYKNHVKEQNFEILDSSNIENYGEFFDGSKDVNDLLMKIIEKEDVLYEEYVKYPEALYNEGKLVRGQLVVDTYSWYNGTVCENNKRIRILGRMNMNRAIHGDYVYVELIDDVVEDNIEVDEELVETKCKKKPKVVDVNTLYGKVVSVFKRGRTELIGTIINNTVCGDGPQNVLVLPIDKKYPPVRIRTSQIEELINKRLFVELEEWNIDSKYPLGHYFKKISNIGDVEGEVECILLSYGVKHYKEEWKNIVNEKTDLNNIYDTDAILSLNDKKSSVYSLKSVYDEVENDFRKDLRDLRVFSIDPVGCTDVDDALHVLKLENGNFEVGVHIADVSHYVKPHTCLDKISSDRSTTIYLPNRRIDMLPEFLSSNLCSLLENVDRAAFSVVWELDSECNIVKTDFLKTMIKSKKAFSYEEALDVLENKTTQYKEFYKDLVTLSNISKILRKRRIENGSLDLSFSKIEISDGKSVIKGTIETNHLIEEFMLLANISVAEHIFKECPETAILRKHPKPTNCNILEDINIEDTKSINKYLSNMDSEKVNVFKRMLTKCMNQAYYLKSDETSDFYHYGLAVPMYTHFTSPIRRYADILVHRLLEYTLIKKQKIGEEPKRYKTDVEVPFIDKKIIENINFRHNSAKRSSWDIGVLYMYLTIAEIEPETEAFVTDIKSNGALIYVPEFNINTSIYSDNAEDFHVFDKIRIKINKDDELFFLKRRFNISLL